MVLILVHWSLAMGSKTLLLACALRLSLSLPRSVCQLPRLSLSLSGDPVAVFLLTNIVRVIEGFWHFPSSRGLSRLNIRSTVRICVDERNVMPASCGFVQAREATVQDEGSTCMKAATYSPPQGQQLTLSPKTLAYPAAHISQDPLRLDKGNKSQR